MTSRTAVPQDSDAVQSPDALLVGDSVAEALVTYVQREVDPVTRFGFQVDAAGCRRLVVRSCADANGHRPKTVVEVLAAQPMPPTVIIAAGYNDWSQRFADDVDEVLTTARAGGATRVLWLTYHEDAGYRYTDPAAMGRPSDSYSQMNEILRRLDADEVQWPELELIDWNATVQPDWLTKDGVHLRRAGAWAFAELVAVSL